MLAEGISGIEVLGLADVPSFPEAPETAPDFEGNAVAKARDAVAACGLPAIADDSGIAVDALNGMPGVLSARWSGRHGDDEANLNLVLGQLGDVPDERRGAQFVCAAALVLPSGEETVVRGEWRGTLVRDRRGTNGFGYDPIFRAGRRDPDVGGAGAVRKGRRLAPGQGVAGPAPGAAGARGGLTPQEARPRSRISFATWPVARTL